VTSASETLPRWDLTTFYPGVDTPTFARALTALAADTADLAALFDAHGVGERAAAPLDDATVAAFDLIVARYNALLDAYETLDAYTYCLVAADSRDDAAQAARSRVEGQAVGVSQLGTRFTAWIGTLDVEALVALSEVARAHAFALRQAKAEAAHLMSPAEERLAAELDLTGGTAWGKLHGNWTSQLTVELDLGDGDGPQRLPMSLVRNLAYETDRETRRRAYEAELATWAANALPLAAALNSVKGEVNTLSARRRWDSPLDAALFANGIDRDTLDAMLAAARDAFPDFRRYFRAKARALGLPTLAWYDLYAPVGAGAQRWDYAAGADFIADQFATYSPRLSAFARRAFRDGWIDAEPRPGKEDGGFCVPMRGDESRVLVNYTPAFDGVSTLAHELGHAYHHATLGHRTALQRATPMTLAETASIFCETIIRHAALAEADTPTRIALLDASLQGAGMTVVDITSRFLFEQRVFEGRRAQELSIDDLNGLMLEAQRETYGEGLDPAALHPYMWAVKSHYYSSDASFYNFPYMFGLLFGLGLYARYTADPAGFQAGYDDLLSSTGLADAATLAARFGINLHAPDFWRASFDVPRADIDRFERLTADSA